MKCPKCGLMQSQQPRCKRCGNPLESRSAPETPVPPDNPDNPYAPPVSSPHDLATPDASVEIVRDGEVLIARDGTAFPDRCVRCNEPTDGFRFWKTFSWHLPAWYALALLSIFIYVVVALVVRKKASFELALCPRHRSRRQWGFAIGFGLPIVAFMMMMATEENLLAFWAFLLALLVGAVVGIVGTRVLTCKKIDDGYAYLKGAHPQFLASFPALR